MPCGRGVAGSADVVPGVISRTAVMPGIRTASRWQDVPARLVVVLPCSNRVLTLRRILHARSHIPPLKRTDRVEWRIQCIRFSLPHLPRTGTGVVPVVRLLSSPIALCPGCRGQRLETQDHATAPSRRSPLNARLFRNAPPFARVAVTASDHQQGSRGLMLTALILIVLRGNRARPDPARCRCRRYSAGTARHGAERRGAKPDRRLGPAPARGLCTQADSNRGQHWPTRGMARRTRAAADGANLPPGERR